MKLEGTKVALMVADLFEDLEFWYPNLRMQEEGARVSVIGPEAREYHGKHGLSAVADTAARDARPEEYDILIIPGGYAPDYMRRSPEMVQMVRSMHESGKTVAAVCHAPWMLASANIIRGKRVTSFYSLKDDIVNAGGNWVDEAVVRDGGIITSRRVGDLPEFCRAIIESFSDRKSGESRNEPETVTAEGCNPSWTERI